MGKSKRAARLEARRARQRRDKILKAVALVVVIAGASAAFVLTRAPKPDTSAAARGPVEISRGPADAPVTVTEYGDFNCPACKAYHEAGIIDQVLARYPNEVRFVFRHFPVIAHVSPQLAEAAECAYDEGAFWEFYDLLFAHSPTRPSEMVELGRSLGIESSQFEQCVQSRQYADLVEDQLREALQHGFRGTPSFTVNHIPLAGPPSFSQLISLVEEILAEAG